MKTIANRSSGFCCKRSTISNQLRPDLAALERERLIESFLDDEHSVRVGLLGTKASIGRGHLVQRIKTAARVHVHPSLFLCAHVTDSAMSCVYRA
jgi:hypothetical protein